ncbi:unnamed protein product [Prunus brigantina]
MFQFLPFTKGKATTMGGAPSREDPQLSDSDEEQSEEEEIYEDVEESVEEKRRRSAERGPKTPSSVDEVDAMLKALKLKYNPNVKNPVKLYHFVAGDTPQAKGKWVTSEKLTSYSFRKTSRMEIDNDEDGEEEDESDEEGGDSWWILSVGDPDKIRAKVKVSDEMQLNGDQRRVDFIACAPTRGVWAMKFYTDEDYRAFVAKYKDCLFENTYRYEATDENRVKVYGKDFIGWAKPEVADDSVWEDAEDSLSKSPGSATPLRANEDLREEFEEASNGGIQSLALGALDNSFLVGESGIQVVKNFSHGIQGKGVYVNFDDGGYRGGSSLARSTPRKALLMKAETNMLLMSPMNEGKPHTTGLHQFDIETGKVVTEWKFGKDGTDVTMRDITNDSKGAQLDPSGSTFLGLDDNRLCRWDMRDRKGMVQDLAAASGPVLNWNQGHQFSRGTNFQCFASTGDGSIAVGSLDGKIRLYSSSSMRQAKTAFPGLGSPITHVDVTFDGKWILGTTDTYLILICTIFNDKDGKTKTGFGGRMGNRISAPRLLKLSAVDSHLAGVNNKFRNAQFSWVTENGKQERHLVATVGKFSVIWNFQQVKDGSHECYRHQEGLKSCYCYKIVLKDDSIVDSRFMHDKFAVTDSPEAPLVIATPMKVSSFSISNRSREMAAAVGGRGFLVQPCSLSFVSNKNVLKHSFGAANTCWHVKPAKPQGFARHVAHAQLRPTWLPGLDPPPYLDGSLAGDFGFDPLGLGEDPESLRWYVQAELVHARFAMLGVAGILLTDLLRVTGLLSIPVWYKAGAVKFGFANTETLFLVQLILMGFVETKRYMDFKSPGSQAQDGSFFGLEAALEGLEPGYPGGPLLNPLGLAKDIKNAHEWKLKEIKNGRLAMVAMLGIFVQASITHVGPIDNLVEHLSNPWHRTIPDNHKEHPSKATTRSKRVKASHPESEPEYLEEPRNLEDLWKAAFPVGTEWDQLDAVYRFKWDFSNLEQAFEEGGKLYGIGNNKVYLFGGTEPQQVPFKGKLEIVYIPIVVAVVSPCPPSDKIGIKSVQRETEEIVPMKEMKMDWVPYIPLDKRDRQVVEYGRKSPQIFVLGCTQRRAALKHMKIDRLKKFDYCLPYLMPIKEEELELSTEVDILFPAEPNPPVYCVFDWQFDEVEEFADDRIKEEELSADQKDAFMEFVKEKVRQQKRENREKKEARRQAFEKMSVEAKAAFENLKYYKFYPVQTADTPDISAVKASYINRYYNKAHEVL